MGEVSAPEEKKFCGAPKEAKISAPEGKKFCGAPKVGESSAPEEKSKITIFILTQ